VGTPCARGRDYSHSCCGWGIAEGLAGAGDAKAAYKGAKELVQKAGQRADDVADTAKATNKTPNPYGSKGKPDHQQTVGEEAERIGGQKEVAVTTPGGEKTSRRIDAARVENGKVVEAVQVYRPTPTGQIPACEVRAARDIENATGVKPQMVPVRPLKVKEPQ